MSYRIHNPAGEPIACFACLECIASTTSSCECLLRAMTEHRKHRRSTVQTSAGVVLATQYSTGDHIPKSKRYVSAPRGIQRRWDEARRKLNRVAA